MTSSKEGRRMGQRSTGDTARVWSSEVATVRQLSDRRGMSRALQGGESVVSLSRMDRSPVLVVWNAGSGVRVQRLDLSASPLAMSSAFLWRGCFHPLCRVVTAAPGRRYLERCKRPTRAFVGSAHSGAMHCMQVPLCSGKVVAVGGRGLHLWDTSAGALELRITGQPIEPDDWHISWRRDGLRQHGPEHRGMHHLRCEDEDLNTRRYSRLCPPLRRPAPRDCSGFGHCGMQRCKLLQTFQRR